MSQELKAFASELAEESGELIRSYWQKQNFTVSSKADSTPVTDADRDAEKLLRTRIEAAYPEHGIIGEEFGTLREEADYVWILDPIDGTKSFVGGVPLFTTLIGLLHKGEPVLGVIHQPVLRELVIGDGSQTLFNGEPTTVQEPEGGLSAATFLTTTLHHKHAACYNGKWEKLVETARVTRTWGDGYGYLLVATGRAHLMCDPILEQWDLLPLLPVLKGAGAVSTAWDGGDPRQSKNLIAAAPNVHQQALAILNR